jgi:hypothetical protein
MTEQVTDVNQLSTADGRLFEHEDCGLCGSMGEALDAGLPRDETIASMEQWYINHKDSPVDGTGCEINAAWLRSEGLDAVAFVGDMNYVDGLLANGWRVTLAIRSNSAGYPYSGPAYNTGHFIELCYPNVDGTYTVMQPVGGYTTNYSRALLAANSQNCGIVVHHDYRQAGVTTVVGTSSGGIPMSFDPNKTRRGLNDVVRFISGLPPATGGDLDWDDAHAVSLGGGEEEWLLEGAIAGTDPAEDQQIHRGLTILHSLAQGQIPPELAPAIKALVGGA